MKFQSTVYLQKIGEYEVSLLFGALHPNEPVTLTFQFQAKKGEKLKLHSERGEVESLYIVDETKENFLYAMPVDTDEQLQYRITFLPRARIKCGEFLYKW